MSDSQPSQDSTATVTEDRDEILYFAYGPHLSTKKVLKDYSSTTIVGLGFLRGWRWIINDLGYANIIPSEHVSSSGHWDKPSVKPVGQDEDGVYGMLYLLQKADEIRMDDSTDVPLGYSKAETWMDMVADERGQKIEAMNVRPLVYVDKQSVTGGKASGQYKGWMEEGIEDAVKNWGLGEAYAEGMREWLRQ